MNDPLPDLLSQYRIEPTELNLLNSVENMDGLYHPARLISYARFLDTAGDEDFSVEEYEAALDRCFQKGWLKVLTVKDCERDKARWVHEPNQFCSEAEYK